MSYNKILTKENYLLFNFIYFFNCFSLPWFFLNENSTGGAQQDYLVHKKFLQCLHQIFLQP